MEDTNRVYRIRTKVGEDAPNVIHVPLNQTYDMFEILSLKLNQTNTYKSYESDYGVLVGRVTANGGFGIPNAKVSVFIEVSDDETLQNKLLYNFTSASSTDNDGVRYNLLPDYVDDACHQNVGTFPNKRLVLDNKDILETFDKYWKYTTTTNHAGDYMIFGIPTGSQKVHVDVDLSDCGILSQRPRDMIGKGYNAEMFESPNKFKSSTNLNSLAQIVSEDRGVYIYPYWGDVSEGDDQFSITRCDINLQYKFEPTAVFIGSIVTDKGSNAIGKNCTGTENNGKMSDLIAGEGTIEMIRKTLDGKVEEFPIMGNRLIDGDGVWCYQIPMNLDYVTTDEFGNLVPTDNPDKGIATRTRVRFRISLDENPNDATARKRARYLVPNNPRMGEGSFDETLEADYEFGSATREESYCDMFWNKVYTVKNYIPKLQKNSKETNRKHTGIKLINHYGDNNPMPYNALTIKLSFTYRLICVITKVIINLIEFLNQLITVIGGLFCLVITIINLPAKVFKEWMCIKFKIWKFKINICPFKWIGAAWELLTKPFVKIIEMLIPYCIGLSSDFCDDGINRMTYYPGCGYFFFNLFSMPSGTKCVWDKTKKDHDKNEQKKYPDPQEYKLNATDKTNKTPMLYNCVENELAQANDATSFNFYNDWVNGTLYAPLWYRKITPKKSFFFGLFKKKAKDDWCSAEREYGGLRIIQPCATPRTAEDTCKNFDNKDVRMYYVNGNTCGDNCHKTYKEVRGMNGVIQPKETMLGQTVYYYRPLEYDVSLPDNKDLTGSKKAGEVKLLFATDIVLLGSLNDCDMNGVPQFFKTLESTTYDLPSDVLFTDYDFVLTLKDDGTTGRQEITSTDVITTSEMAGCDWGNPNEFGKSDGGLFYSIGCSSIDMVTKSCINLSRICEYGVSLDETKYIPNLSELETNDNAFERLVTDGYVSWDELYNLDERSMFATMNGNNLKTKLNNTNGLREYDFRYLYPENFDGSLHNIMDSETRNYSPNVNYKLNFNLEQPNKDYYLFRMGNHPYFYDKKDANKNAFPRYENSFYFYFGLKAGKTAIEKFNAKYFAECNNADTTQSQIGIKFEANTWCSQTNVKYININDSSDIIDREAYQNLTDEQKLKYKKVNQNDGYAAFDFSNISTPYSILINGVSDTGFSLNIEELNDDKFYISNEEVETLKDDYTWLNKEKYPMFDNGSYQGVVTDANGNITEFSFKIDAKYLTYKLNAENFKQPNNVLLEQFSNNYKLIASDRSGIVVNDNNIDREIGGVITVYDIYMNGETLDFYSIEIRQKENTKKIEGYDGISLVYYKGVVYYWDGEYKPLVTSGDYGSHKDIIYGTNKQLYAFGLPKGGVIYTITITQRCGDSLENSVDSDNSISKDVTLNEPTPYKMFINEIDYDLIRNFDDATGWSISGTVNNSSYSSNTIDLTNPWLSKINNVFYNSIFEKISELYIDEDGETIYYLDENSTKKYIGKDIIFNELAKKRSSIENNVYYNWVNDYIISDYDSIADINESNLYDFIDKANEVLSLRRNLPEEMRGVFYMSCKDEDKQINIRVQTSDLPGISSIIYHPESASENSDSNILESNNVVVEDTNEISDIKIPTITYHSSIEFGDCDESQGDKPCIAKSNGYLKKPYSVGVMNDSSISIPKKNNGASFDNEEVNGFKRIKYTTTNALDLFNFPIIDKILKADYIVWSAIENIPKYGVPRSNIGSVTMNGLLSGFVFNGNIDSITNSFETQTLCNLDLLLSKDINDVNPRTTYVEKRVFNGYDYDKIGNLLISSLKTLANTVAGTLDYNKINIFFDTGNLINRENIQEIVYNLKIVDNNIVYEVGGIEVFRFNIVNKINDILCFTNYKVVNNSSFGTKQYMPMLPMQTQLILEDTNGCGIQDMVRGDYTIELSEDSVNDCRNNGSKILQIDADDDTYYYIYNAGTNGAYYPINLAQTNGLLWQIKEEIYGVYTQAKPQNLFSYQMTTSKIEENSDKDFISQISYEDESGEEVFEDKLGYGTTGTFTPARGKTLSKPVFIVSETDNHQRTISPVYDYTDVYALLKFGILERKEVEEQEVEIQDEDGNKVTAKEYIVNIVKDYKFGVAIKVFADNAKNQFYLNNYSYTLEGVVKIDNYNTIEVRQETLDSTPEYVFTTISENLYKTLQMKVAISRLVPNQLKKIIEESVITAVDYTGLKHICNIDINDFRNGETGWYIFMWNLNLPKDDSGKQIEPSQSTAGIILDDGYTNYVEDTYEKNDTDIDIYNPPYVSSNFDYEWLGWSEDKPEGEIVTTFPTKADASYLYYGNWIRLWVVKFFENDGTTQIGQDVRVRNGGTVTPPTSDDYTIKGGDGSIYDFTTPITSNMSFVKTTPPTSVNITFNVSTNGGKWYNDDSTSDYVMEVDKNTNFNCDKAVISSSPLLYGFVGWSENSSSTSGSRTINSGTTDKTVYAIFKEKDCEISIKDISTSDDNITLEIVTASAAGGTHFEWTGFTGECGQNMVDGSGTLYCNGIVDNSVLKLYVSDENFYQLNGNSWYANLFENKGWQIEEINKKLSDYNICYEKVLNDYVFTNDDGTTEKTVAIESIGGIHHFDIISTLGIDFVGYKVKQNPTSTWYSFDSIVDDEVNTDGGFSIICDNNITRSTRIGSILLTQKDSGKQITINIEQSPSERPTPDRDYIRIPYRVENQSVLDYAISNGFSFVVASGTNSKTFSSTATIPKGGYVEGTLELSNVFKDSIIKIQDLNINNVDDDMEITWLYRPNPYTSYSETDTETIVISVVFTQKFSIGQ